MWIRGYRDTLPKPKRLAPAPIGRLHIDRRVAWLEIPADSGRFVEVRLIDASPAPGRQVVMLPFAVKPGTKIRLSLDPENPHQCSLEAVVVDCRDSGLK